MPEDMKQRPMSNTIDMKRAWSFRAGKSRCLKFGFLLSSIGILIFIGTLNNRDRLLLNGRSLIPGDRMMNVSIALKAAERYLQQKIPEMLELARKDVCFRYFNESNTPKEIYKVWSELNTPLDDVTLVTFLTVGKFDVLDMVLKQWPGPLSLTIYVDDVTNDKLLGQLAKRPYLLKKKHVELSIIPGVFEFFPNNWLRQTALDQARTEHVLLFDVDLIPSKSLYENLLAVKSKYTNTKKVLVIPSFELAQQAVVFNFPKNKSQLVGYFDRKLLTQFHADFIPAYGPTNHKKWSNVTDVYEVTYEVHYEPYVFAERRFLPNYPVGLQGCFHDKSEYFCLMKVLGYKFEVLHSDFAIHFPHLRKKSADHSRCAKRISPCLEQERKGRKKTKTYYYSDAPSAANNSYWIF